MSIEITARHMEVSGGIYDYACGKAKAVLEDFPKVEHVHIILDKEKKDSVAEIVLQAGNHVRIEADASSDNMRTSIDLAVDKMEIQLRKLSDKVQKRRRRAVKTDKKRS